MSEWIDQVIEGHRITEEIGRGGAAAVYRAYQKQLERWVAIKILRIKESGGRQFLKRFQREARAIAALRHPNILTIFNYGEDRQRGIAYIIMEYVPGGSLAKQMKGQAFSCVDALKLIIPVGEALTHAHRHGVIHRDVKPDNILLAQSDWPLLVDFGLAKIVGSTQRITQPGSILGTAVYLSPEQVAAEDVDHRTDIYSLGIVLYEMLAGRLPFDAETPADSMMLRLHEPPEPIRRFNSKVPKSMETVLMRALERQPEARYASMESFVSDLQRVLHRMERAAPTPEDSLTARMITSRIDIHPTSGEGQARLFIATSGASVLIPPLDEVLIGRMDPRLSRPPDIDLDPYGGVTAGMSRRHARLLRKQEGWFLEDLQSTNGTYVNEVRLLPHRPIRLHSGDLVRFGQLTVVFEET